MSNLPAYRLKSNAELEFIVKDASEALKAVTGYDDRAAGKYADQVNDACTVLHERRKATAEAARKAAVNNAIASSNRSGRRIGRREARLIHSLLQGG